MAKQPDLSLLSIDEKWDIQYDHNNNDRPVAWFRHRKFHSKWDENNPTSALFYRLLGVLHYGEAT